MHKKFEINHTKIKGGGKSGRKAVTHDSNSDLPLGIFIYLNRMLIDTRMLSNKYEIFMLKLAVLQRCPLQKQTSPWTSPSPAISREVPVHPSSSLVNKETQGQPRIETSLL